MTVAVKRSYKHSHLALVQPQHYRLSLHSLRRGADVSATLFFRSRFPPRGVQLLRLTDSIMNRLFRRLKYSESTKTQLVEHGRRLASLYKGTNLSEVESLCRGTTRTSRCIIVDNPVAEAATSFLFYCC